MFWAVIIGNELVGSFRVPDRSVVPDGALTYRNFLQDNFIPCMYRSKRPAFRKKKIVMQNNAPSHAPRFTVEYLAKIGFKSEKLMTWPSSSPDLNPIENFWSLLKRKLYTGGKQYASKDELWDSILQSAQSIGAEEIR